MTADGGEYLLASLCRGDDRGIGVLAQAHGEHAPHARLAGRREQLLLRGLAEPEVRGVSTTAQAYVHPDPNWPLWR